ncbi:hypothetical protein PROFUN_14569 [Planoprotostelium fungivorum]|uniref:Uncharacterized protein n=1 Tax=Planoprotostelium fungivorum TaxID=1890364 RepID=A0A2P6MZA9_9EUKA|nr:hypothetical protein PROFUN_14569 [Planoprotostelium fungivorum]
MKEGPPPRFSQEMILRELYAKRGEMSSADLLPILSPQSKQAKRRAGKVKSNANTTERDKQMGPEWLDWLDILNNLHSRINRHLASKLENLHSHREKGTERQL